jgi:hypothetical protein
VVKTVVPGVQGAFVLSNVLSPSECDSINSVASAMGFTEDAPVADDLPAAARVKEGG